MAELTAQKQAQSTLQIHQEQFEQKTAQKRGMKQMPAQEAPTMPAQVEKRLQAIPVTIPKKEYQGVASSDYEGQVAAPYRELHTGMNLASRKEQFNVHRREAAG